MRSLGVLVVASLVPTGCTCAVSHTSSDAALGIDAPDVATSREVGLDDARVVEMDGPPDTGLDADRRDAFVPVVDAPLDDTPDVYVPRDVPRHDVGPVFDDGGLDSLPWVEVELHHEEICPAPTSCGGDPTGRWEITGGCVFVTYPGEVFASPDIVWGPGTARIRGRVVIDGVYLTRDVQYEIDTSVTYPGPDCAGTGPDGYLGPESWCAPGGAPAGCRCTIHRERTVHDLVPYLSYGLGGRDLFAVPGYAADYCVGPGALALALDDPDSGWGFPLTFEAR